MDLLEPVVDDDGAAFWSYAADGELRMQACAACGELRFPPRPMCPHCQSETVVWQRVSGRGTVWSYAVPHPPLLPAYAELAPYVVAVIALDDHPELRLVGNVVPSPNADLNALPPAAVRIGMPVTVAFRQHGGMTVPCWIPVA